MLSIEMQPGVHWIGVNDRTTDLFEGMWPIRREGVSYNSYAIRDEKNVLVDLAKAFKTDEFIARVGEIFDVGAIDYIVINHTEPDHTGALPILCRLSPQARIKASAKAKEILEDFYGLGDRVDVVVDGDELDIGSRKLKFYNTPLLHWPDTIMTWDPAGGILFSCDAFGGYGALPGAIFDDSCESGDFYREEALRYYANIVSLFSPVVTKTIERLSGLGLDMRMIAPSHGLVWRKNPLEIVELYRKWASWFSGEPETGVTLLYGSMYGNTENYMNAVARGLASLGVPVNIFDVARTHSSYILPSILRYRGVLVGAPTYEAGLFPPMAHQLDMVERKKIRNRVCGIFGSRLWSGGAQKEFAGLAEQLKWTVAGSREFHGGHGADLAADGFAFGREFGQAILDKTAGIFPV